MLVPNLKHFGRPVFSCKGGNSHEWQVKTKRDPESRHEQLARSERPQKVLREAGKTQRVCTAAGNSKSTRKSREICRIKPTMWEASQEFRKIERGPGGTLWKNRKQL